MSAQNQRPAPSKNEQTIIFQFSENKQEMQSTFNKGEPWIVAVDACNILGLSNVTRALERLDEDEKLTLPLVRAGQLREVNCVNESGLYNLIFKSRKPEAKIFRKWVTSEVLPAIRKTGFYSSRNYSPKNFIDARDIPFSTELFMEFNVRIIDIDNVKYYSLNDLNSAIRSTTSAHQISKKLNAKQNLAHKIWLFGSTNPGWFVNKLGMQLVLSGSRIFNRNISLTLNLGV